MSNDLRIWLLGGFRVAVGGQTVAETAWRRSKARALVKVLALAPGHKLHREELIEILWPGQDPQASAANLRKAVHFARQALGPTSVRLAEAVSLETEPLWIDVEEFEHAIDPATGVALYLGELLPEDRFETWTEAPRERLKGRFLLALQDLATEHERKGDLRGATAALDRLTTIDPLNEEAYTALIRLYALAGRRQQALTTYRRLKEKLRTELGVEPSDSIRDLYEGIMEGRFQRVQQLSPQESPVAAVHAVLEERKLVSVVYVEVDAPRDQDPERERPLLDGLLVAVSQAFGARGASVERVLGDSVVAIFGVPVAHEDDAARALEAAEDAMKQAAALGGSLRVGVDSGEVLIRGDQVLGEPMRSALHKCEEALPGQIRAGDRTLAAARRARRSAPLTLAPLLGRDAELSTLRSLFSEANERMRPRLVLISGVAGVGKSRLVAEAVQDLQESFGAAVLRGRCLAGQVVTYWPFGEVLRSACGVLLDDTPSKVEDKLRRRVGELITDPDREATLYALASTAGIALPGSPLENVEPKTVAEEQARAWPRFLSALSSSGPCVLVIEDLHWAGEPLLQLLEQLVTRASGPILVLVTARPDLAGAHPGFGQGSEAFSAIALRPLADAPSQQLLAALTANAALSDQVKVHVLSRAEGNPYFLEELARHLADASADALPDTIHSLLAGRIDGLPPLEKMVLQEAAVVGRVFWAKPIARSLGQDDISESLQQLERRGLVFARSQSSLAGHAEWIFKHALVREVAYASLPQARRAKAHAQVGEWMEELAGERREEFASLIAHHLAAAANSDVSLRQHAYQTLLWAGKVARHRFAVGEAVDLHGLAVRFAANDAELMTALEELGDDHASAYHGDAAMESLMSALNIARSSPNRRTDRARLCWKTAALMGMYPGAFRNNPDGELCDGLIREGLDYAADELSRAQLLAAQGAAARLWRGSEPFGQGKLPDPIRTAERIKATESALEIGERLGRSDLVLAARSALGILYGIAGRYSDYLRLSRQEIRSVDQVQSRLDRGDILRRGAVLEITVSADFEAGLQLAHRCHDVSRETNPHQLMHATWPLLAALYWLGRWDEMEPFLDEHIAAFRIEPSLECSYVREGPVIGALMLAQAGDVERARSLAALVGDPLADPESASPAQGRLAVVLGDPAVGRMLSEPKARERNSYGPQHAVALLDALVALQDLPALFAFLPSARQLADGNALLAPWCDRAEAIAVAAEGKTERAQLLFRRATRQFKNFNAAFELARTKELLGQTEARAQ